MVQFATFKNTSCDQFQHPEPVDPNETLFTFYTSGTTGQPKAALLTHRNYVAQVFGLTSSRSLFTEAQDYIGLMPFAHPFGLCILCAKLALGHKTVTLSSLRIERFFAAVQSCKVVDLVTKKALGPSECGEICIRGPTLFKGYQDMPEATADAFDASGFFLTGDTGYYTEDGHFHVSGRIKDLIKCMDQQVAPAELEALLLSHPEVKEAVVAGVPHPEFGEAARAFIVLRSGRREDHAVKESLHSFVTGITGPYARWIPPGTTGAMLVLLRLSGSGLDPDDTDLDTSDPCTPSPSDLSSSVPVYSSSSSFLVPQPVVSCRPLIGRFSFSLVWSLVPPPANIVVFVGDSMVFNWSRRSYAVR
ncbi:hypothetical protein HPB49_006032 [Dermacentor silvarum]|uniref:Uncharacterized protein n=1 Tax=Dermacentor silvarum TaxID=543639 RepID=A0ACB8DVF2_DERSI|nr:hypothetical protein HPB49_006032 [Dermacentor silvarum]